MDKFKRITAFMLSTILTLSSITLNSFALEDKLNDETKQIDITEETIETKTNNGIMLLETYDSFTPGVDYDNVIFNIIWDDLDNKWNTRPKEMYFTLTDENDTEIKMDFVTNQNQSTITIENVTKYSNQSMNEELQNVLNMYEIDSFTSLEDRNLVSTTEFHLITKDFYIAKRYELTRKEYLEDGVSFKLLADGKEIDTIELGKNEFYKFEDNTIGFVTEEPILVPLFDKNGNQIEYTLEEIVNNNEYLVNYEYDDTDRHIGAPVSLTRDLDPIYDTRFAHVYNLRYKTDIAVHKVWVDDNPSNRPESVNVHLWRLVDNKGTQTPTDDVYEIVQDGTITAENGWEFKFTDIPTGIMINNPDGWQEFVEYTYKITEDYVEGYTSEISEIKQYMMKLANVAETDEIMPLRLTDEEYRTMEFYDCTIKNTKLVKDIIGQKYWDDENEKDRPEKIILDLMRNSEEYKTTTTDESENWKYEFKDLPILDENGDLFEYEVVERPIRWYKTEYNSTNGLAIKFKDFYNADLIDENMFILFEFNGNVYGYMFGETQHMPVSLLSDSELMLLEPTDILDIVDFFGESLYIPTDNFYCFWIKMREDLRATYYRDSNMEIESITPIDFNSIDSNDIIEPILLGTSDELSSMIQQLKENGILLKEYAGNNLPEKFVLSAESWGRVSDSDFSGYSFFHYTGNSITDILNTRVQAPMSSYQIKHEYYVIDKDGNEVLEGTVIDDIVENIESLSIVGITTDDSKVDIEVTLKPEYKNNSYELSKLNNTEIKEDVINEIVVKYTRNEKYGSYQVKHEYYAKDSTGNVTLENTVSEEIINDVTRGTIIKANEQNHVETNNNKTYTYSEDSGDIIIETNKTKEITIKYIREKLPSEDDEDNPNKPQEGPKEGYGSYQIKHQYYVKDYENNLTLENEVVDSIVSDIATGTEIKIDNLKQNPVNHNKIYEYIDENEDFVIEKDNNTTVIFKYVRTEEYGSYTIKHEYYTRDKDGNEVLDKTTTETTVEHIVAGTEIDTDTIDRISDGYSFLSASENTLIKKDTETVIVLKYIKNKTYGSYELVHNYYLNSNGTKILKESVREIIPYIETGSTIGIKDADILIPVLEKDGFKLENADENIIIKENESITFNISYTKNVDPEEIKTGSYRVIHQYYLDDKLVGTVTDTTVSNVETGSTVDVKDADILVALKTTYNGIEYQYTESTKLTINEEVQDFVIKYTRTNESEEIQPATLNLTGTVILKGNTLKDKQFSFKLNDGTSNFILQNNVNGNITFNTFSFDKEGTYKFTVVQDVFNDFYYKYDKSKYEVTIVIAKQNNQLVANVTYLKDGVKADKIEFVNEYNLYGFDENGIPKTNTTSSTPTPTPQPTNAPSSTNTPTPNIPTNTSQPVTNNVPTGDTTPIETLVGLLILSSIGIIVYKKNKIKF